MFQSVMRSPMLFFETTPSPFLYAIEVIICALTSTCPVGVILNRFSRDVYVIDEMLARFIRDLMRMIAIVVRADSSHYSIITFLLTLLPVGVCPYCCGDLGATLHRCGHSCFLGVSHCSEVLPRYLSRAKAS